MACEDAETLAYALYQSASSELTMRERLSKWEAHRIERLTKVQTWAKWITKQRAPSPSWLVRYLKEWIMWVVFNLGGAEMSRWLIGYDFKDVKDLIA